MTAIHSRSADKKYHPPHRPPALKLGHDIGPKVIGADIADGAVVCSTIWVVGVAELSALFVGVGVDCQEKATIWLSIQEVKCACLNRQPVAISARCHRHVDVLSEQLVVWSAEPVRVLV